MADAADLLRAHGRAPSRTPGIPIALKDLFDIAGEPTPAGSVILADAPAGASQCPGCRPHAGRWLHPGRAGQHDRVRVLRPWHQPALRHPCQPVGPGVATDPGRQFVGHRGGGR